MSASADEAKRIVENLNMIRPYGSIGPLSFDYGSPYSYGTSAYFDPFKRIGDMRTYTEGKPLHDSAILDTALAQAKLILFLGFGYHATNLDLLKTSKKSSASVHGTAVAIHHGNLDVITERIIENFHLATKDVTLHINMNATSILRDLRQRILINLE